MLKRVHFRRKPKSRKMPVKQRLEVIRNSPNPIVSVVIPVMNERKTIVRVLQQASRVHPETEVIVVVNGSTDGTEQAARRTGARVLSYEKPLGHDVGRSIGAAAARGDIILFLDGDIVVPAIQLIPLIRSVQHGVDIALNNYSGPRNKKKVHSVVLAKHVLNHVLYRPDLIGASLTTIPHAMSRRALETIGAQYLAVPPMAMAIAVHKGLNVRAVHYINVGSTNPRKRTHLKVDPLLNLIVGDHLEAMQWLLHHSNERGNRPDLLRDREIVR